MAAGFTTVERVRLLIRDALSVDVPDGDTDLINSGLLDSLGLVTMIVEIEHEFQLELPLDDLDVDRFRSVNRIAEFLGASLVGTDGPAT
jgi:D-alanine--poly(phosphoribitol) ligase subunit 2